MRSLKFILLVSIVNISIVFSQTGTEFWFAAPDLSQTHDNNSIPLYLHITAVYATHVTISRPADNTFTPVEFDLSSQQTQSIKLETLFGGSVDPIEVYARDRLAANFIQNKGFLITAEPGEITAYYEPTGPHMYNTDIVALKSVNALGKDFWVSTQRKYKNHAYSDDYSGFVVVATTDGTVVTIDPNGNNLAYTGMAGYTVTLNKGQAIAVRAAGQAPADHIFGIHVTATKNVAITIYDDSMEMTNAGGSWDTFADQYIPTSLAGKEYVVLKGNVQDVTTTTVDGEAIFITTTQNNTAIYIDGVYDTTIATAGKYYQKNVPSLALSGKISMYIKTSKPVLVNHVTGYASTGTRELGGAILPPIDNCTGSHSVTIKRTPAPGFFFFNNLIVRNNKLKNDAIYNFKYSINGGPLVAINPNHFTYIMDSSFAIYDRTKAGGSAYYNSVVDGQILRVENNVALFHLGVMQGNSGTGCKYGYFSDYASSKFEAGIGGYTMPSSEVYCNLNPIRLVANGATSYKWSGWTDTTLVHKLDYDTVAAPYFFPEAPGIYDFKVKMTGVCQTVDSLPLQVIVAEAAMADFSFSADEGCSPFAPIMTNNSDTILGVTQLWTVKTATGTYYQIDQDTIPRSFPLLLPSNKTDSIQTHKVTLVVKGVSNSCPSQKSKDIKVKPEINADFAASDTIGCHPLQVDFLNYSSGNLDTSSYYWDFGDYSQSFDSLPSKTFTNYSLKDSIFPVTLVTLSPFGCTDTARQDVWVHPRVNASLTITTGNSCSPLQTYLNPINSLGVDTLRFHFDYCYGDSSHVTTSKNLIYLEHTDTSITTGPDTLRINYIAENKFGCKDTFPEHALIVYPLVHSEFMADTNVVCDSVPILFTNKSLSYKSLYEWDFDDGTVFQDYDTLKCYNKVFFNRSDKDSIYHVRLRTTSSYFCEDTFGLKIKVHPFIKANFGIDYANNCAPLLTTFSNLSVRADTNWWNFGDGSPRVINNITSFNRTFTNNSSTNDTIYPIQLVTINREGCSDTLTRKIKLFPNVAADFHLADSTGCSPRDVTFFNNSRGGLLTYLWEFGNSTSSTISDTTFKRQFTNLNPDDTTYKVKLTVANPFGCSSKDSSVVTVFAKIDADFSLPTVDTCSPFTLKPVNLSSTGAKVFEWNFGPYGSSNVKNPVFPFPQNITDTDIKVLVRLRALGAYDAKHEECADTSSTFITIYPELHIDFALDNDSSCQPLKSNIFNNTLLKPKTTFQWRLDNDFYSSLKDPLPLNIPNYTNNNVTHKLKVFGTTDHGCTDADSIPFTVYSLVESKFTINQPKVCSHDSVIIDRSTSRGGITNYKWNYDDGEPIGSRVDSIYYKRFTNLNEDPEVRKITLTVNNAEDCESVWTQNLTVNPKVTAAFTFDNDGVCYPYSSVLNNSSHNATNYYWNFGDGSGSSESNPVHLFENFSNSDDKSFTVWLTARSEHYCFDSISHDIAIFAKPAVDFSMNPSVGCPPLKVQMINASQPSTGLNYKWDFGGLGSSAEPIPSYTFDNNKIDSIQTRYVTLEVTSKSRGCKNQITKAVNIYPKPDASYTYSDSTGCSPINVIFNGSVVNATQYIWYIDGSPFSTLEEPNYRFVNESADNITHQIKFRVNSTYNCADSATHTVTVYPNPITEFIPDPYNQPYDTINDQTKVTFYNQTRFQDRWNYKWEYGDGNSDAQNNGAFDYQYGNMVWGDKDNNFKIPVKLIAWNSGNEECRDTTIHEIIINPPLPQVNIFEDLAACVPYTVDFSAFTKYNYKDQMDWSFGIPGATSSENSPTYTFNKPGVYTVRLEVVGDGGTNLDYKTITAYPQPEANFLFNDSVAMVSSQNRPKDTINFYNQTKNGYTYEWYFENNMGVTEPDSREANPEWSYNDIGVYFVTLIATSAETCKDTLTHHVPIRVLGEGRIQFPTGFFVDPSGPHDEYVSNPDDPSRFIFRAYAQGVEEYSLEIYNRWGVLIYKTNDINKGWNGYIDGKPAKQDVYVWRAKGRFTNGQPFHESGDVTLIVAPAGQQP